VEDGLNQVLYLFSSVEARSRDELSRMIHSEIAAHQGTLFTERLLWIGNRIRSSHSSKQLTNDQHPEFTTPYANFEWEKWKG
jgi:hypothetical protein